jgi:protocatechuate 3,4-dioxygenase beta subunit
MKKRVVVGAGAVCVIAVVAAIVVLRGRHHAAPEDSSRAKPIAPPTFAAHKDDDSHGPKGAAPKWSFDADPEGPLRLEGQVIDDKGAGVGGAEVWLASSPPRQAKTEADGSFVFDKLVGRTYSVSARSGDRVGGPRSYKLTEHSEPLVLQLVRGATADVHVIDEHQVAVVGADVKASEANATAVKTNDHGDAHLTGITPGWVEVEANAPGYARSTKFATLGSTGASGHIELTLRRGAAISGRVVDEAGKPLAKVFVSVEGGAGAWGLRNEQADSQTTDDKGKFSFSAVAPGRVTLTASDNEHAPTPSTPITVAADHPVSDVTITMKAGGAVAGVVVDNAGNPAPFATLRLAGKAVGSRTWRQTTTDRAGKFEVRGLSRIKLQARAESDTAATPITDIDLSGKAEARDLRLVLSIEGTIRGTVVDDAGQAVAEAQVNAFPDLLSGESPEALSIAGMSSATTDGGGGFAIHGLPTGSYRLWADRVGHSRMQAWGAQGATAKTGDDNVRIVLPGTGSLIGKLALATGSPPKSAFVQLGNEASTPASPSDGTFRLDNVTAGPYTMRIYGPEFSELDRHDIKVEVGKVTDLGSILLVRGRQLTGTVIDPSGNPAVGATVKVGQMLFTSAAVTDSASAFEDMQGIRTTTTDQNGQFSIPGVPEVATVVQAYLGNVGCSLAQPVPAGTDDPPPVSIQLRGFATITGKVTMQGQPQANVAISDALQNGGAQATFVRTAADGTFTLTQTPEGTHVISAMLPGLMSMKSTSQTVTVAAGQTATVLIDIPVGTVTLTVNVAPLPNNEVDAAQVFLLQGTVAIATAKELLDGFFQGSLQGMKIWFGVGKPMPTFDQLVPGNDTVCAIPITGNITDPVFQQQLQANMQGLKVYCSPVVVAAAPTAQSTAVQLPAMLPLPPPKS